MRIVQLIDSLEAGGAERMAVNIANSLVDIVDLSAIVITRKEGSLRKGLRDNVNYKFLNKNKVIDLKALFDFRRYLINHQIQIIHAHGTSCFFAIMTKIFYPKVKVFWHDHHGDRVNNQKVNFLIKVISIFFSGIFSVNDELTNWAKNALWCKNISTFPNFATINTNEKKVTSLKGVNGKRIICLANLRVPKNHITLFKAFNNSQAKDLGWSLHLIGKDYNDNYSSDLKDFVRQNNLDNNIFFYGSCDDIGNILNQANIGVLSSTFEGFPVSLLEYGLAKLAVISSNVGYCATIIDDKVTGLLFNPLMDNDLKNNIDFLITNIISQDMLSVNFNTFVTENYSEKSISFKLIQHYKAVI